MATTPAKTECAWLWWHHWRSVWRLPGGLLSLLKITDSPRNPRKNTKGKTKNFLVFIRHLCSCFLVDFVAKKALNHETIRHQKLRHRQKSPQVAGRKRHRLRVPRLQERRPLQREAEPVGTGRWLGSADQQTRHHLAKTSR